MSAFASNPAARSLPLLALLAQQQCGNCHLALPSGIGLRLGVAPCC